MQQVKQPGSSGAMATSATGLRPSNGTVTSSETRSLKFAGMQWLAGGVAGCVEVSIMQPLDVIKTRFQLQSSTGRGTGAYLPGSQQHYTNMFDCMRKMYRAEGLFSFWKGILPPIMVEIPRRALGFFCYEQFKYLFTFNGRDSAPTPLSHSLAGLGSGVIGAFIVGPFEAVKVKMQINRTRAGLAPSTWQTAKDIITKEGVIDGIVRKGLTATIMRNGIFNTWYYGFYFSAKDALPKFDDVRLEQGKRFALGFCGGAFASCFNCPFDVAKSRIQAQSASKVKDCINTRGAVVQYKGTLSTIGIVYRQEGFKALYKGMVPKILRLGPGGAILIVVYEAVYEQLQYRYAKQ